MKLDANGDKLWTRQLGTRELDMGFAVAIFGVDSVYVAGRTSGALDGQSSAGDGDLFVTSYDASGTKLWTHQFGTITSEAAYGVATDSLGRVFAVGSTSGALDGQSFGGGGDAYLHQVCPP